MLVAIVKEKNRVTTLPHQQEDMWAPSSSQSRLSVRKASSYYTNPDVNYFCASSSTLALKEKIVLVDGVITLLPSLKFFLYVCLVNRVRKEKYVRGKPK